jgi:hypothetical protein
MFRFFAVALVIGAFGAALYFSGDALEAWESPQPSKASVRAPAAKKKAKAKSKRAAQPAKEPTRRPEPTRPAKPAKRAWLADLNALCRDGRDELAQIPRPSSPADVATYLGDAQEVNRLLNDEAVEIVRRAGDTATATQLRRLFDRDEAAMQKMLTLAEDGQYVRLVRFARSLVPLARAENRMLAKLGAVDCTLASDEFKL